MKIVNCKIKNYKKGYAMLELLFYIALFAILAIVVVNALILGLTAIAKNPNLGTYKILQTPSVAIPSSMAVRREPDKRFRDFLSVWVDYNRGIGQMREWFVKGLALSNVKPEDVPVELNI